MVRHFPENGMKFVLENPANVRDLLALAGFDLLDWIDWPRMVVDRTTYVQRDYRHVESDLVLHAPIRVPGSRRRGRLLIYFLIEHQSEPDRWMLLRMLDYVVQVYKTQLRKRRPRAASAGRLFPVLPIVFYTGDAPWPNLGEFADLVELGDRLRGFGPALSPLFVNLRELAPAKLEQEGGFLGWVLRLVRERRTSSAEFQELLERVVRHLESLNATERMRWRELLSYLRALVYHVREEPEHEELFDLIETSVHSDAARKEVRSMGRTIAEALKAQGKKKGIKLGDLAGRKSILLLQLHERFGDLPEDIIEAIKQSTDVKKLNEWAKRFAVANSLEDLSIGPE